MKISKVGFAFSSSKVSQIPRDGRPEFAFIGRSNVGKSSLINMLADQNGLAKVSATPGKTRLINHFNVNDEWYLVDLPGYGYAKVSKGLKKEFNSIITNYLLKSEKMMNLFVLVDSRHEPQKIDLEFMEFLGENGIPFSVVFTKTDKLAGGKLSSNIAVYKKKLLESWEELPPMFLTSSEKKTGRDELLGYIGDILMQE